MSRLSMFVTTVFCTLTIIALAMDSIYPEGMNTTPQVHRQSIREASAHRVHGHGGFRYGK